MKYLILISLFSLCSCKMCEWKDNQEKRHLYFMECLKEVSHSQPSQNHEDNNGHVVSECESAAFYQSKERVCE